MSEKEVFSKDEEKLVRILEKIARGEKPSWFERRFMKKLNRRDPEEEKEVNRLRKIYDDDELELAKDIVQYLLNDLPIELKNFKNFFQLEEIDKKDKRFLGSETNGKRVFEATRPYSEELANYGLTVLDIFTAIRGIECLFARALERGAITKDAPIVFDFSCGGMPNIGPSPLCTDVVATEIYRCLGQHTMAKDNFAAANYILLWIAKVAFHKPHLFGEFRVDIVNNNELNIVEDLSSANSAEADFKLRWKSRENIQPAQ